MRRRTQTPVAVSTMNEHNQKITCALAAWPNSTKVTLGQDSQCVLWADPGGRIGGISEDRGAKDMWSTKDVADKHHVLMQKRMIVTSLWLNFGGSVRNAYVQAIHFSKLFACADCMKPGSSWPSAPCVKGVPQLVSKYVRCRLHPSKPR